MEKTYYCSPGIIDSKTISILFMNSVEELLKQAICEIKSASTSATLRQIEIHYLGKQGLITTKMRDLGKLPAEDRPAFGKAINDAKIAMTNLLEDHMHQLKQKEFELQFKQEKIDVTLPGMNLFQGQEHILQQTFNKIKSVLTGLGFEYTESNELETFYANFEVLNYPFDHPAMDDQDTFYITDTLLLRPQCTAYQSHVLKNKKPPFKFFTIGKCFRNDALDRTHSHTFHQVDAFMVDENISMANLKGTLRLFVHAMFGEDAEIRFRPDFFPFVEPGVDYAIRTPHFADGNWLELGGAGMVHPNILEKFDIDTERYTGWAFGLGVDRIPMLAHGIDDLRHFLENDLRFLEQFPS